MSKFGEITLNFLQYVAEVTETIVDEFIDPKEAWRKSRTGDYDSKLFFDNLRRLSVVGYVEVDREGDRFSVKLTKKGRIKLLEHSSEKKRDGKWRMISYDIPEEMRTVRNAFRNSIRRIGFKQIQKSLWVCPYVKADELELVIDELKLHEYVAYMVVEKTDIDDHISSLFEKSKNDEK